jgi:two-component system, OmpR family, phosphate regulon response regulator PhoB
MDATILVIEESLDLCRLFEYMLRADGYTVQSFHDWQTAQTALSQNQPDLIIFDWSLANTSGYVWAESLRLNPATAHIPVLFVCGDPPTRADLEMIGGVGISVIEKPFDIFMFRNRVTALLAPRERAAGIRYI